MASKSGIWKIAALLALTGGCAAEVENAEQASDEAVLDHVEALGFSRDDAVVAGNHVIVEGDLRYDRAALARGEYERTDELDAGTELIEKGYRYPGLIAAKHRGNIQLLFASGAYAPTKAVRDAFVAAAKAWSSVPGSSIRISPSNTGPAIVVRMVPAHDFEKYSNCKDTEACADAPLNGRPGYEIFIRSESKISGCEKWAGSNLVNVTRHEMGHALGFAHPKEAGSKLVSGTKGCTKQSEKACVRPGYSTVMGAPEVGPKCSITPARLTQDDYATCAAVYPAK